MIRILRLARCAVPALLVAGYTLTTSWTIASTQLGPRSPEPPDRLQHGARFEGLRSKLDERQVDTVGYVRGPRRKNTGLGRSASYFRAQYALAPVIVRESILHRYVVADFRSARALEAYLERTALAPVARYGHGLALLRNDSVP